MRFHFRWAATALFVVAAVQVPAAIRLFDSGVLGLIGMACRKAVLGNHNTKTMSRMNVVITLLLSLFAFWTNSAAAALIFSNTHSYEFRGDPAAIPHDRAFRRTDQVTAHRRRRDHRQRPHHPAGRDRKCRYP